jgi:hypothetical protein
VFAPFREAVGIAKLDYQISKNYKMFYRSSCDQNSDTSPFEATAFQPLNNTTQLAWVQEYLAWDLRGSWNLD